MTTPKTLMVDNEKYIRERDVPALQPNGNRAVVVVDRGWIWAGDVTEEDGRIYLDRAVWVFRWESVGFDGVLANPKSSKVTIKPVPNRVDIPKAVEVFRVPVAEDWGL